MIYLDINRFEIFNKLSGDNNIGVELGVAKGNFSESAMYSNKFKFFYGVDSYTEFQHNSDEFLETKKKLAKFSNYKLLRSTFNDALDEFEDNSLDFIYIDGFAHTGNNGGEVIERWSKKIKVGGIIAGDDYDKQWPLVIKVVNELIKQTKLDLYLTKITKSDPYSDYASWFVIKNNNFSFHTSKSLKLRGKINHILETINRKLFIHIRIKYLIIIFLKKILSRNYYNKLKNFFIKYYD